MATNERQRSAAKAPVKKTAAKQRGARNKVKLVIFGVEVFIILVMVVVLVIVLDLTDNNGEGSNGPTKYVELHDLPPEELGIPQAVIDQKADAEGAMYGYMNIALFGVDAKNEKDLYKNSRSDSIMVASINMDTGDIKLVSVYRDSYLNLGNDSYHKCNGAYSSGGAERAVKMLNMNLDLDITDFITVGYAGLAEVIDGLGGVWIDVDEQELKHINNYQYSILGKKAAKYITVPADLNFTPDEYFSDYDFKAVAKSGYQMLDGLQATAYCRIRYAGNNDFQRTERQREVIKAIETQAKQADVVTLLDVFKSAAGDIYTSLDESTIMELLPHIMDYRIAEEGEFPGRNEREPVNMGAKGICEVPLDLEQSVIDLHKFLFDDDNYQVSDTVKEIRDQIESDASKYRSK